MVNCSKCGADVEESNFCPNCGTKVENEELKDNFCSNCGANVGESNFCPNCGTKVVKEEPKSTICPNCGTDAGESNFCPSCGTKMGDVKPPKVYCSNCGKQLDDESKFCPYCGGSESQSNADDDSHLDTLIDIDDKLSGKMSNLMGKSKIMDKTLDAAASFKYSRSNGLNSADIKYYQKVEPVFLEALDTISDEYVKSILIFERSVMMNAGGSIVGLAVSQIYTPTKDLDHDEAIRYYQGLADEIKAEINAEKQKGTFDEEEFFKKKVKQSTLDNTSVFGISKSVKAWKRNKK